MNKLNGRPLHERVVVKLQQFGETTQGGIFLPEEARETTDIAVVYGIGNLVNKEGEALKIGDKVIIQKRSGLEIKIDGEKFQLLMKHDIHFVYNDENDTPYQGDTKDE
jgi:chaperonin GroES